jgi:hypothetical protein
MDRAQFEKLNHLMLSEGSLTIEQFQTLLSQELSSDAPLVRQLKDWESNGYHPSQLLSLKSVLRDHVTLKQPSSRSLDETMRLIQDDVNGVRALRDIYYDLFVAQRLHKWVSEYEAYYTRATSPN